MHTIILHSEIRGLKSAVSEILQRLSCESKDVETFHTSVEHILVGNIGENPTRYTEVIIEGTTTILHNVHGALVAIGNANNF
jgi:hypothetical protein